MFEHLGLVKRGVATSLLLAGFSLTWRYQPTALSQLIFVLLLILSLIAIARNSREYSLLCSTTFGYMIVSYFELRGLRPDIGTILIGLVSFGVAFINQTEFRRDQLLGSLILAFLTTQTFSIFSYFPLSLFNKSLLTAVSFYLYWQTMEMAMDRRSNKQFVAHFLFVTVVVMVILGGIIWSNFPQLLPY